MMRKLTILILAAVFIGLAGCTKAGGGPTTWLDQPLDNTKLPLARTQIMAHASDDSGVASFEFFIDKDPLVSVKASGGKFGEALVEWEPKAPGEYTVRVHAVNGAGNAGPDAISIVTVGEVAALVRPSDTPRPIVSDTPTPAAAEDLVTPDTVTVMPADATGPEVVASQNANCRYGPSTAYQSVGFLLKGEHAPIVGRNDYSNWFVINLPGKTVACWVSGVAVDVTGDADKVAVVVPPELIITVIPEEEAIVEPEVPEPEGPEPMIIVTFTIDVTRPTISNLQVSDNQIVVGGSACTSSPSTTTLSATVIDEGGVSIVMAGWSFAGQESDRPMNPVGGGVYQTTFGPYPSAGTLSLTVYAEDTAGNGENTAPVTVNVINCIE